MDDTTKINIVYVEKLKFNLENLINKHIVNKMQKLG